MGVERQEKERFQEEIGRGMFMASRQRPGWLPPCDTAEGPIIDGNYWIRTFNLDKRILTSDKL